MQRRSIRQLRCHQNKVHPTGADRAAGLGERVNPLEPVGLPIERAAELFGHARVVIDKQKLIV